MYERENTNTKKPDKDKRSNEDDQEKRLFKTYHIM